jgi:amino acid adenylation domain-containing protein
MKIQKIDKAHVDDILPLTSMQEGMLFQYLSNPQSKQYFEQMRFGLKGQIDNQRFREAWKFVGQGNEMLRAVTRWEKLEEPVQIVLKDKEIPIEVKDLSVEGGEEQSRMLAEIVEADWQKSIDLTEAPLRITLCLLANDTAEMVVTFHHILYDGWSSGILLSEFIEAYNHLTKGETPEKVHKTRYRQFLKWYRSQDRERQSVFWKYYLEEFDTRSELPYDHSKLAEISRVNTCRVEVSPRLIKQIDSCSQQHRITLSNLIYTAWGVLLQKYNNSNDVIFGTIVAGRTPAVEGIERMVGLFINTIPLRLKAKKDEVMLDILAAVGSHLKERQEFEHSSLTEIQQLSGLGTGSPLFDSIIVVDNYPLDNILGQKTAPDQDSPAELAIQSYEMFEMTNFDLTLQVMLLDRNQMRLDFHYNPDAFELATIRRLADHYLNILAGICTDPKIEISAINMISEAEERQILEEFNQQEIEYRLTKTIHGIIEAQVARVPENRAVQFEDHWLSYRELNERANRLAYQLEAYGVVSGSRVAMLLPRSVDMIVPLLAILKLGAIFIPLDVSFPDERNRYIALDSGVRLVLTASPGSFTFSGTAGIDEVVYDLEKLAIYSTENPQKLVQPQDPSHIIYTSGSTGRPKGALLHHSGIVNHTYTKIGVLGITEKDSVANNFSINVIASVWQVLSPLFMGGRLVTYSDEIEWDPYRQFERVAADGVTVIEVIPSVLKAFLFLLDEGKKKIDLSGLRKIGLTAEEVKPFLVNNFYKAYPHVDLVDCYGQTENCDDVLHYTIPVDTRTKRVPIGTPSLNTQVLVLNHHNQLQPVGIAGEICSSGAGVGYGYWNRPDLTAEKFVENPLQAGVRMYRTGDLGRFLPDGTVEYLGRLDHQVKIRGNRVELREIENHVLKYPGLKEAAVVAREDREGDQNLYAFFVSPREITAPDMRGFLLKTLPDYMVPLQFIQLEKLPVIPNGKINRKALVTMEIKESIGSGVEFIPPRSDFERAIQEIWAKLLAKERQNLGINDNFFDLGGHSLMLIKLKSHLEKNFELKQEVEIVDLFNFPTIALQAQYVEENLKGSGEARDRQLLKKEPVRSGLDDRDLAAIGISLRFPGAANQNEFWENLSKGTESIAFFNEEELEDSELNSYIRGNCELIPAWGLLGDLNMFDADFFGIIPREAEIMDPQQRLFLEYSWMALEDAGYVGETYPGLIGAYAGVGFNTYILNNVLTNPQVVNTLGEFQTMIANDKDFLASRVAYKLNLKGPAITIQCACSTSLVAIHLARQGLISGDCDMALVGGVSLRVPERTGYFYTEGGHLSPDGHCRAFDAGARGTVFGNGIGIVVLKKLTAAVSDSDNIYAVLKGSAINNDGSLKVGYTSPSEKTQAQVILNAITDAAVDPGSIGYVETHGTGTVLGDPIEISALSRAFRTGTDKKQYCAIGSVKSNIGHLDVTAGIAGVVKAILCLKHRQIPPSINFASPNPMIDFENSPFFVNQSLRDWPAAETPRRAGVSALGIGGTNGHVILEEAPAVTHQPSVRAFQLILLSGRTESALNRMTENLLIHLEKNPNLHLADAAYTLQTGRKAFKYRRKLAAANVADVIKGFTPGEPGGLPISLAHEDDSPVIFMFPGQGSQYVNMGLNIYRTESLFRQEMDRCFEIVKSLVDVDLPALLFPASPKIAVEIEQTDIAQPLLFVFEYALARLLMKWGIKPYAMIGHSIGEYVAACLAGVFSLDDALKLVCLRGKLMAGMPAGAMLSVSLSEQDLMPLLNEEISLAAVNSSSLCAVSGPVEAIAGFEKQLKTLGHEARRLHTSHAFHSPMMAPILAEFSRKVGEVSLHKPGIPFISNVSGDWISPEDAASAKYWADQLRATVRFADGIGTLLQLESPVFMEVGPGNVLSTFVRRYSGKREGEGQCIVDLVRHPQKDLSDAYYLLNSIGQLWLSGVKIDWQGFHASLAGETRRRLPLPTYPFQRKNCWLRPKKRETRFSTTPKGIQFYLPIWKQSTAPLTDHMADSPSGEAKKCWLIFLDQDGIGTQLVKQLLDKNQDIITVRVGEAFKKENPGDYLVNPGRSDDYAALIADVQQAGRTIDKIVHLWMYTAEPLAGAGSEYLATSLERGVYSLLYLVKALARHSMFNRIDLWMVSNRLHKIDQGDIIMPEKATILGPCKVVSQEYPHIVCRSLDVGSNGIPPHLLPELEGSPSERLIAYRGNYRWLQSFEPVQVKESPEVPAVLREKGVYLITGGLGKIGLTLARYLARSVQARLVLTSRSPLPEKEDGDLRMMEVRQLEQMGARVLVVQADCANRRQMQEAVKQAEERFGAINGVIHTAGVTAAEAFKMIADLERQECEVHFTAKIEGLYVLKEVFQHKNLDFYLLTSSLSSILGGLTLYAYSAAHSFMDGFARQQRLNFGENFLTLDWPTWEFGEKRAAAAALQIKPGEGEAAFKRALHLNQAAQVVIANEDLQGQLQRWVYAQPGDTDIRPQAEDRLEPDRSHIQGVYQEPQSEAERIVAGIWQELLGIKLVGVFDDFFELGGHSLIATKLASRLREVFRIDFPLKVLFNQPTIRGVVENIVHSWGDVETVDEIARTYREVEMMG